VRGGVALALLAVCMLLADRIGLVALIAKAIAHSLMC
jgi:hypothetical protein